MLSKANEYNLNLEDIEMLVGQKNYVDIDIVTSDTFLDESELDKEKVLKYLSLQPTPLVYHFIEYFNLSHVYEDIIGLVDYDLPVDELLIQKKLSNPFAEKIANIADSKKIYITNHFFFILIYAQIGRTNVEVNKIAKIPIFIDEAHQINDAATAFFSNSFSPYRLSIYLTLMSEASISKKDIVILKNFILYFKNICEKNDSDSIIEMLKDDTYKKDTFQSLRELVNKLSKKKTLKALEQKYLAKLKQELMEMIYLMKKENLQVSFSAIKKLPTISSIVLDSAIGMRNMWVKNKSMIVCISGTFRVSKNNTYHDNEWSFQRIGFLRFKAKENKLLDKYYTKWNERLLSDRVLMIEESIFNKNQAIRYIVKDLQYTPPKIGKDSKLSNEFMLGWIKRIADKMANDFIYKNSLILMTSFENCELLYDELVKKEKLIQLGYTILYSSQDKSMRFLQEEYKKLAANGHRTILIGNISFFTGIDLPNKLINTLIIGKLPFEPNHFLQKKIVSVSNYGTIMNNRNKAIITFRQGIGRGLRNNLDKVFIAVCDPRIYDKKNTIFLYFIESMSIPHKQQI